LEDTFLGANLPSGSGTIFLVIGPKTEKRRKCLAMKGEQVRKKKVPFFEETRQSLIASISEITGKVTSAIGENESLKPLKADL